MGSYEKVQYFNRSCLICHDLRLERNPLQVLMMAPSHLHGGMSDARRHAPAFLSQVAASTVKRRTTVGVVLVASVVKDRTVFHLRLVLQDHVVIFFRSYVICNPISC
jgi:hypothetical protein